MLAKLIGNQSEQVQRVRIVWIAREDGLIDASSLVQAAGLMVLDSDLHGVLHSGVLSHFPWCAFLVNAANATEGSRETEHVFTCRSYSSMLATSRLRTTPGISAPPPKRLPHRVD